MGLVVRAGWVHAAELSSEVSNRSVTAFSEMATGRSAFQELRTWILTYVLLLLAVFLGGDAFLRMLCLMFYRVARGLFRGYYRPKRRRRRRMLQGPQGLMSVCALVRFCFNLLSSRALSMCLSSCKMSFDMVLRLGCTLAMARSSTNKVLAALQSDSLKGDLVFRS